MYFVLDAYLYFFFNLMNPLSLYKIGSLNVNVRYVENNTEVREICLLLLRKHFILSLRNAFCKK